MIMRILLSLFILISCGFSEDDINQLLLEYRSEAELSKITKVESAGFVDIYTREDLEKMQAHTLLDVLKSLPTLTVTRTSNDLTVFSKSSVHYMPTPAIKLYINDHDVTSASGSSTFLLWADMPIEHINHIEVYKAAASIEFSNEPGTAIIKLYTKKAEREEGSKLKLLSDQVGSYGLSAYIAHTSLDEVSYFTYATTNDTNRKKYYNQGYEFNSDKSSYTIYSNISYKDVTIELSRYHKENNSFMGIGTNYTPEDGGISSTQTYIHLKKKFKNNLKFQMGYDYLDHESQYYDENGIYAGSAGMVSSYYTAHQDKVLSLVLDKKINFDNSELLLGSFYKYKGMKTQGEYDLNTTRYRNDLHIYSIYAEHSYHFNDTTMLITSLKGDYYQYDKEIEDKQAFTARVGLIKNIDKFQIKAFATRSYYPVEFTELYSEDDAPSNTNPDLDYPQMDIYMASVNYKNHAYESEFRASYHTLKNNVILEGTEYVNSSTNTRNQFYIFKQTYHVDKKNKIILDIFTGDNSKDVEMSPKYGLNLRVFNNFGKWNIYNEFIFKSDYEAFGVQVDNTLDYAAAIKYLMSSNFSCGLRGENIFNTGYEQAYKNFSYAIPVTDQKVWINLEYLF